MVMLKSVALGAFIGVFGTLLVGFLAYETIRFTIEHPIMWVIAGCVGILLATAFGLLEWIDDRDDRN